MDEVAALDAADVVCGALVVMSFALGFFVLHLLVLGGCLT